MPFHSHFVEVGHNVHIHVMRRPGPGRKIVLLHGFGDGCFVWLPFARTLPSSTDLYILDLRGHGESSWYPLDGYSTENYVGDVLRVFAEFELKDVALVGHSLGAQIAIHVATSRPECVWKLVLVDVSLETNKPVRERIVQDFIDGTRLFASTSEYLDFVTANRPLAEQETLKEFALYALRRNPNGHYRVKADPLLAKSLERDEDVAELWSKLSRIQSGSLLVRGEGSAVLTSSCATRIVSVMPRCAMVKIGIAGHGVMVDNPLEFSASVNQFLTDSEKLS